MKQALRWLTCYGAWFALSALAGITAWYLHTGFLYLAALALEHPSLRPPGWSTATLAPLSKASVLVVGSIWLLFVMWMESALRRSMLAAQLGRLVLRLTLILAALWILCYGLLAM